MSKEIKNHAEDELDNNSDNPEEQEIDLMEIAQKLWAARKTIIKIAIIAAIAGVIVAFSIPKEYTTTIKLSPELEKSSNSRGLSALANLAGLSVSNNATGDAVNPILYPDVVESVPFIVDLFDIEVTDSDGEISTTLYNYIDNYNATPWWSFVISLPFKAIGGIKSFFTADEKNDSTDINPFQLSKEEYRIKENLSKRIEVNVDQSTAIIEISVVMQDPLISAVVADSVASNLKAYVTKYRTDKARKDLEYATMLNQEAKEEYFEAQQAYADYVDRNHGIAFNSAKVEMTRLQNDVQLKYNLYDQTAQRVQLAKAKVQENTPVYAIIQPATVPIKASKPRKFIILIGFIFMGIAGSSLWILYGSDFVSKFKNKNYEKGPRETKFTL